MKEERKGEKMRLSRFNTTFQRHTESKTWKRKLANTNTSQIRYL